ncbi:MAG: GerW family sporulation protein [Bacilli bacterium]
MAEHPIQGLMKTAMENLKEMVDVNTIVGEPVETPDGSVIIPISKVGFGFAAGGSEFGNASQKGENEDQDEGKKNKLPFGGGSGGGVSITPVAFLVVGQSGVRLLSLEGTSHLYDRIIESAPQMMEKLQGMIRKGKESNSNPNPNNKEDGPYYVV